MNCYQKIDLFWFFILFQGSFEDILGIQNQVVDIEKSTFCEFLQKHIWPQNRFFYKKIDFSIKNMENIGKLLFE